MHHFPPQNDDDRRALAGFATRLGMREVTARSLLVAQVHPSLGACYDEGGARRDALDAMAQQAIVAGMDDAAGGEAFRFDVGIGALRGMLAPMFNTCGAGRPAAPPPGDGGGGPGGGPGPSDPPGSGGRGFVVIALGALAAAGALGVGWWLTRGPGSLGPAATRPNPGAALDAGVDYARAAGAAQQLRASLGPGFAVGVGRRAGLAGADDTGYVVEVRVARSEDARRVAPRSPDGVPVYVETVGRVAAFEG